MLGGNLRESGSEFQRTLPEYTRLDLIRLVLGTGILNFPECRDWFRENLALREGVPPDIILCMRERERETERERERERQRQRQRQRQTDRQTDRQTETETETRTRKLYLTRIVV